MTDPSYKIRPGERGDHSYVIDTWISIHRKMAEGSRVKLGVGDLAAAKRMLASDDAVLSSAVAAALGPRDDIGLVRRILYRPTTELRVAADVEDPAVVLGYAVVEANVTRPRVYFVSVRNGARNCGLATALLRELRDRPTVVTHTQPSTKAHIPAGWSYSFLANFVDMPLPGDFP